MVELPILLTALSEDQRAQVHSRITIIRPALEDGATQAQVARTYDISKSTIGRWAKRNHLHTCQTLGSKGFLTRMPASAERLDLLLLTVAKTRRVQQDGIRIQSYRYLNTTLADYVQEDVFIGYDPADDAG